MDASDTTRKRVTELLYANYIIQKQRLAGGCSKRNFYNGTGSGQLLVEVAIGESYTTLTQRDAIIAQNSCPIVGTLPTVTSDAFDPDGFATQMTFTGTVTNTGGIAVTERGVVWNTTGTPTVDDHKVSAEAGGLGEFTVMYTAMDPVLNYARAYAINSIGVSYGAQLTATPEICLAAGTMIFLADGTMKRIEDICYSDSLLVWNFDEGHFDEARPLWLKRVETTTQYNRLTFSDGMHLNTIGMHRIFNLDKGTFTPAMTAATPIGTRTFNVVGKIVELVNTEVITEKIDYYNIITEYHLNVFADGILTSCRYNNIYPINDKMRFIKVDRVAQDYSNAKTDALLKKYYKGLRLAEQIIPAHATIKYVRRLEATAA